VPEKIYKYGDLKPTTLALDNGFYYALALAEPETMEANPTETLERYRGFLDPVSGDNETVAHWYRSEYKKLFEPYYGQLRFINQAKKDWWSFSRYRQSEIQAAEAKFALQLERYRKMLAAPILKDFVPPRFSYIMTPGRELLRNISRLYTVLCLKEVQAGRVSEGVTQLLRQLEAALNLIRSSRCVEINNSGKDILRDCLEAIQDLINGYPLPDDHLQLLLRHLPPPGYADYGSENAFIGYFLDTSDWFETLDQRIEDNRVGLNRSFSGVMRALFQKQRTCNYYLDYVTDCIQMEKQFPYQWTRRLPDGRKIRSGFFWWVQNPTGKWIFTRMGRPDLLWEIYRSYRLQALYLLTRIAVQLKRELTPGHQFQTVLQNLDSYKNFKDPFSGQPFRLNLQKQGIYSLGPNGRDDQGKSQGPNKNADDIMVLCLDTQNSSKKK